MPSSTASSRRRRRSDHECWHYPVSDLRSLRSDRSPHFHVPGHRLSGRCGSGQPGRFACRYRTARVRRPAVHLHHGHCLLHPGRQPDGRRRHLPSYRQLCKLPHRQHPRRHERGSGHRLCLLRCSVRFRSATVVAIGSMLYADMVKQGYPEDRTAGLLVIAGGLGPVIPRPSSWCCTAP